MGTGDTIILTIQLFTVYRKLTDEIHKYETRLDTLKLDLEEHNIKLAELEKIAQQAQSHHDRNSQALDLMKDSSGCLLVVHNIFRAFTKIISGCGLHQHHVIVYFVVYVTLFHFF